MNATTAIQRQQHAQGITLMLVSTACFSANVLLIRALGRIEPVDVWLVSAVRFAVGLAVLAAFFRREVQFARVFRHRQLIGRGVVGGLATVAFYLTIFHLGAGLATFIGNTYVIFAALLAVPVLGERLRPSVLLGGLAALAGLALITDAFNSVEPPGRYEAVGIAAALASAFVVVTIRQLHATEHTATIFAAQCIYGLLISVVPVGLQFTSASPLAWGVIVAGGLCTAGGQLLMTRAFRDLAVAEGTLLQMLVPFGVALGGFGFFGERFSPPEIAGATLILAGTAFTALRR